jgi:chromosome partitioning protein
VAKHNSTIAVVSTKGGSGKTTVACCLAGELSRRGRTVTLIDADPVGGMSLWHAAGGPLNALPLLTDPTEAVTTTAAQAARRSTVIIDTAGAATSTLVAALEAADVVLVPTRPSAGDAVRALETVGMARKVAQARRRRIPIKVLLVGATPHSSVVPYIRGELEGAGAEVLATEIHQRTAYVVAGINGTAPCWMGYAARLAAEDMQALADELGL